jgi:hypothetical protein
VAPAEFKPEIPAKGRLQTHALDRVATDVGKLYPLVKVIVAEFEAINGTDILYIMIASFKPQWCNSA